MTKENTKQAQTQAPIACRQPKTFTNYIGHNHQALFGRFRLNADGIALLLCLMEVEPLEPSFEDTLGYEPTWLLPDSEHAKMRQGMKSYTGNFHRISCVFNIDTRDPALIAALDEAIALNLARPDYQEAKAEYLADQAKKRACIESRLIRPQAA